MLEKSLNFFATLAAFTLAVFLIYSVWRFVGSKESLADEATLLFVGLAVLAFLGCIVIGVICIVIKEELMDRLTARKSSKEASN